MKNTFERERERTDILANLGSRTFPLKFWYVKNGLRRVVSMPRSPGESHYYVSITIRNTAVYLTNFKPQN